MMMPFGWPTSTHEYPALDWHSFAFGHQLKMPKLEDQQLDGGAGLSPISATSSSSSSASSSPPPIIRRPPLKSVPTPPNTTRRRASFLMNDILKPSHHPSIFRPNPIIATNTQPSPPPPPPQLMVPPPSTQAYTPAFQQFRPSLLLSSIFNNVSTTTAGHLSPPPTMVTSPSCSSSSHSPCSMAAAVTKLNSSDGAGGGGREECHVCQDKASGYHYGVMSCEGCKGFFRRTVQKSMEYVCHKDAACDVNRVTRNRCQSCRFNKCLRVGMSRESVRQDKNRKRKPKDEQLERELVDTERVHAYVAAIHTAQQESMLVTGGTKVSDRSLVDVLRSDFDTVGIGRIATFAHRIPGFDQLSSIDQTTLVQRSILSIVLLRAAFFYTGCTVEMHHPSSGVDQKLIFGYQPRQLVDMIKKLRTTLFAIDGLKSEELALLSAICLLKPDIAELHDAKSVDRCRERVLEALQMQTQLRAPTRTTALPRMLVALSDLFAF